MDSKSLLVVDNDKKLFENLKLFFKPPHYEVVVFSDFEDLNPTSHKLVIININSITTKTLNRITYLFQDEEKLAIPIIYLNSDSEEENTEYKIHLSPSVDDLHLFSVINDTLLRRTISVDDTYNEELKFLEHLLFEKSKSGFVFIDNRFNIKKSNKAFSRLVNISLNLNIQLSFLSFIEKYSRLNLALFVQAVQTKKKNFEFVVTLNSKTITVNTTFFYRDGDYKFGIVTLEDTTGYKQLSDLFNNYRYAIDKTSLVTIIDTRAKIISVNDKLLQTYNYKEHEIIGESILIHKSKKTSNDIYKDIWRTITSGNIWQGELLEQSKDGEESWKNTTITPFLDHNNKPYEYMIIQQDITKRKLLEEKEKEHIVMDKALKMKDEFMANMSHEIRTPLNVILGYSDLLLESELSNEQYKQISTLKKSGRLLLSVINDILDLSKLESGKLVLANAPFDLRELLQSVKDMLDIEASKKELDFNLHIDNKLPQYVIGDATRIEQILVNLINNAIKFTKVGFVKIEVDLLHEKGNQAQINFRIKDSGIGIAEDKLQTIFESFTQSTNYITREYGGTGLGLTIVKKIVNQLQGDITLTSVLEKGSTFSVSIPFEIPEEKVVQNIKSRIAIKNNRVQEELNLNILLAEDNEHNQILAKTRLQSWGCNVDIANNGLEAVEKLRVNDYHLILMDIQMPIMSGYEATQRIRSEFDGYKKEIPILALTAHASNGDANKAKAVGFDDYLFKPFNIKLLHSKLYEYGSLDLVTRPDMDFLETNSDKRDVVDFTYIESETLGNESLTKLLIESFLKEFKLFINSSKKNFNNEDWKSLYKDVHRIAPSVSNFNIQSLISPITELLDITRVEENFKTKDVYQNTLNIIEQEFAKVLPIFKNKVESIGSTTLSNYN